MIKFHGPVATKTGPKPNDCHSTMEAVDHTASKIIAVLEANGVPAEVFVELWDGQVRGYGEDKSACIHADKSTGVAELSLVLGQQWLGTIGVAGAPQLHPSGRQTARGSPVEREFPKVGRAELSSRVVVCRLILFFLLVFPSVS